MSAQATKGGIAVVIGSATTAMSCARLLAMSGRDVYAACKEGSWPTFSRYFQACTTRSGRVWRGQLGDEGHEFLRDLPFQNAILVPAADDAALWLAALPDEFAEKFRTCAPPADTLSLLQDKDQFAELVASLSVPAPASFVLNNENDVANIDFASIDSLFLKPVDSQAFVAHYRKKALWVASKDEAIEKWRDARSNGFELIAQEYVPGGADDHYFIDGFVDSAGRTIAKTARRRLRIYPADFGNSSYCRSTEFANVQAAWPGLEKLLKHVKYRGIFSAEFKVDKRTGDFKILEINTRPWVYIEFAQRCGMNMCDMHFRDACGEVQEPVAAYAANLDCVDLYNDLVAVYELPREARPDLPGLLRTWLGAFKLLASYRDPKPCLVFLARQVKMKLAKLTGGKDLVH